MRSSYARIAIFVLIIALSHKFTFASVNNVTRDGPQMTKIFRKFFKVPWINWDTPWIHQVKSTCASDIATLFKSALAGEIWALRMLDATSKIPSGILTGNIRDLGMYDECIRVKAHHNSAAIQGRHCMVSMSMPSKFVVDASAILDVQKLSIYNPTADVALNFAASLCLPSSCGVKDITSFVNASIHQGASELVEFGVRVAKVTCSSIESEVELFTLGTILTISFFAMVFILLLFCTACDFWVRGGTKAVSPTLQTIAKFSIYTNAVKLASTKMSPETMPAIHGIRFLSMFFMVVMHRILNTFIKPFVNLSEFQELRNSLAMQSVLLLSFVVDTFFTLTGFLTAYLFLDKLRSGQRFNLFHLYIHRYLRLAPCMAALILINIFIFPRLGSGPIWEIISEPTSEFCRRNWWTNLLYVQNFVNSKEMCMLNSWYLAVEMQLFWICPIILYPLFHQPKLGLVIAGTFFIISFVTPAVQVVSNQYSALFSMNKPVSEAFEDFMNFYDRTYNRALPYFVGILLGYYVVNKKRELSRLQAASGWILTCVFMAFCFWNTYYVQPNSLVYNAAFEAAFVSVGRLGWSLAISWILYACTQGHGGPVTKFLSLPIFVPLSRLAYCIYLVSSSIQVGFNSTIRTAESFSSLSLMYIVWSDLVVSVAAAFVLSLCFETPIIVLEKILIAKRAPAAVINRSLVRKKQKLLDAINEYLDSTKDEVASGTEIKSRMSQSDFWRTVSAASNTLEKRSTKTSAEWTKICQDWEGVFRQIRFQGNAVKSVQSRTDTIIAENDLLILLAALIFDFDGFARSEKSGTAEVHEPPLDCRTLQIEGFPRLATSDSNTCVEKKEPTDLYQYTENDTKEIDSKLKS